MCHHIKKNKVIILLKMNESTGAIRAQHPKKVGATSCTIDGKLNPFEEAHTMI
jgi:hypothetical protein